MNETTKLADFSDKLVNVRIGKWEIKLMNVFKMTMYEHVLGIFWLLHMSFWWLCVFQIPTSVLLLTDWAPLPLRYIHVLYLCWIFYDRQAPRKGRSWLWFRKLPIFRLVCDYFPIRLVKTAELPPDKNYLLAYYPHGVFPVGLFANFGIYANKTDELYPNIDFGYTVVNFILRTPYVREIHLFWGALNPEKSTVENFLNSEPSKALAIAPDGAAGVPYSFPGNEYFIRNDRKGFIRAALRTGASLVPVFSFGEINYCEPVLEFSGWVKTFSNFFYKLTRTQYILVRGAGLFQQTFGLMPRKVPITTVVGEPIPVPKTENPSEELVDEFHDTFLKELEILFDKYKHEYDQAGSNAKLKYI